MAITKTFTTKKIAFVAIMGALGNILALLSTYLGNIHPQVALDFSHIATFIVALNMDPLQGFVTGCLVSIVPFYRFGLAGWLGPIIGFTIIPLKGLSGLFGGVVSKRFRPFIAVTLGYLPESISTYIVLRYLTALFLPAEIAGFLTDPLVLGILFKAWIEIVIIAFLMELINRNKSLNRFFQILK